MEISSPLCITSRLLPGCRIGDAEISIEYAHFTLDGRQAYRYFIDLGEYAYQKNDLASGVGGGTLQESLESLLGFLGAFAEAIAYRDPTGKTGSDNEDLFPVMLGEWATANADEIAMMEIKLREHPNKLIIE